MPASRGARVPLSLPRVERAEDVARALAEVIAAMAAGRISPDEAATMIAVVAAPRQAIEATEFEARIRRLEEQLARLGPQQRGNAS